MCDELQIGCGSELQIMCDGELQERCCGVRKVRVWLGASTVIVILKSRVMMSCRSAETVTSRLNLMVSCI